MDYIGFDPLFSVLVDIRIVLPVIGNIDNFVCVFFRAEVFGKFVILTKSLIICKPATNGRPRDKP